MLPMAELHKGHSWSRHQAPWQESGSGGRRTWGRRKRTGGKRQHSRTSAHDYDHGWDGKTLEPLSQCDSVNKLDDSSTHGEQRAQWCAVSSSVWVMSFTQLVTVVSTKVKMRLRLCTMFRSLLYHKMFVNFFTFSVLEVLWLYTRRWESYLD